MILLSFDSPGWRGSTMLLPGGAGRGLRAGAAPATEHGGRRHAVVFHLERGTRKRARQVTTSAPSTSIITSGSSVSPSMSLPTLGLPPGKRRRRSRRSGRTSKSKFYPARDAEAAHAQRGRRRRGGGATSTRPRSTWRSPRSARCRRRWTTPRTTTGQPAPTRVLTAARAAGPRPEGAGPLHGGSGRGRTPIPRRNPTRRWRGGPHPPPRARCWASRRTRCEKIDAAFTASIARRVYAVSGKYDPKAAEQHLNAFVDGVHRRRVRRQDAHHLRQAPTRA